jgi:ParB-like chromosome segregation protein Spo0J
LGWTQLEVGCIEATTSTALVLMLSLNRRFGMSQVEEALVVREMIHSGLTGTDVGKLLGRHKSWVSRRLGLLERLAPELQEEMKLGLLDPGVARRLLALPRGNQLELAAVVRNNGLGPRLTERLVALWRQAPTDEARQFVLTQPNKALEASEPATMAVSIDPRLSGQGQRVQEKLRQALQAMGRLENTLWCGVSPEDLPLLEQDIASLTLRMKTVSCQLGRSGASES